MNKTLSELYRLLFKSKKEEVPKAIKPLSEKYASEIWAKNKPISKSINSMK